MELPNRVFVIAANTAHAREQMHNYGYVDGECRNLPSDVKSYRYLTCLDKIRGLMDVHVWVLEGATTSHGCSQRANEYYELMHYIMSMPQRYHLSLVPEINSEGEIVDRSLYDDRRNSK